MCIRDRTGTCINIPDRQKRHTQGVELGVQSGQKNRGAGGGWVRGGENERVGGGGQEGRGGAKGSVGETPRLRPLN